MFMHANSVDFYQWNQLMPMIEACISLILSGYLILSRDWRQNILAIFSDLLQLRHCSVYKLMTCVSYQ